jgi:hypothetical protein
MTVILVLFTLCLFLGIDALKTHYQVLVPRGTMFTTPGFEMLGAMAQDGGERVEIDYEI